MGRSKIASVITTVASIVIGIMFWGYLGIEDILLSIDSFGKMVCFAYLFVATIIATGYPVFDLVNYLLECFDIGDDDHGSFLLY